MTTTLTPPPSTSDAPAGAAAGTAPEGSAAGTTTDTTTPPPASTDTGTTSASASESVTPDAAQAAGNTDAGGEQPGTDEAKKDAPVEYTLTKPDGTTLTDAALERIAATSRERGLSPEQAQAVVDLTHELTAESSAAVIAGLEQEHAKIVEGWSAETLADAFLGKTAEERTQTIQQGKVLLGKYAAAHPDESKGLIEFLETSGYGNNVHVARLFAFLGRTIAEKPLAIGTPAGAPKDARALFPNSNMNP